MGANVSSQTTKIISETTNNILNEFSTNSDVISQITITTKQTMNVRLRNVNCSNISVQQVTSNKLNVLNQMNDSQQSDLSNKLQNAIQTQLEQGIAQENSGLNLGQVNVSEQNNEIKNYLTNNLKNVINQSVKRQFSQSLSGEQIIEFDADGMNCDNLNISQDMVIEAISKNIAQTVLKGAMKNVLENETIAKAKQSATQKNVGLSLGFGGLILVVVVLFFMIFKAKVAVVSNIFKYILPISLVITIGLIIYMSMQKGANMPALPILIVLAVMELIAMVVIGIMKTRNKKLV